MQNSSQRKALERKASRARHQRARHWRQHSEQGIQAVTSATTSIRGTATATRGSSNTQSVKNRAVERQRHPKMNKTCTLYSSSNAAACVSVLGRPCGCPSNHEASCFNLRICADLALESANFASFNSVCVPSNFSLSSSKAAVCCSLAAISAYCFSWSCPIDILILSAKPCRQQALIKIQLNRHAAEC